MNRKNYPMIDKLRGGSLMGQNNPSSRSSFSLLEFSSKIAFHTPPGC